MSEHELSASTDVLGTADTVADQCRALGLQVGDTIEGTEGSQGWWCTTRLTLLWLGDEEAAWLMTDRSSTRPDWSAPCEAVNWTLHCRDWRKVVPNAKLSGREAIRS